MNTKCQLCGAGNGQAGGRIGRACNHNSTQICSQCHQKEIERDGLAKLHSRCDACNKLFLVDLG